MLIGFMGAGGTGKTTTAKFVSEMMGIPFIASSSRVVFKEFGIEKESDQYQMTIEEQKRLQLAIFKARESLEKTSPFADGNGVSDRTLLDQVAYNIFRAGGGMSEIEYRELLMRARSSLTKYDVLFYFPIVDFGTTDDGMREVAFGARYAFASILERLIRELFFIPPITIPNGGSVALRANFINTTVQRGILHKLRLTDMTS